MRTLPFLFSLCAAAAAQGVTSPRNLNAVEGNNVFAHWGGSRRFQQIDLTQAGTPLVINSISWRRNGSSTGAAGTRTFDFSVDLGRGDFGAISNILDNNFIAGTRTNVFNQPAVLFPDWSASLPGPAPFDFVVMLPAPYVYNGIDALVIDYSHTNNSASGTLSTDRDFIGATTPPAGTLLGTGCIATGRTSAFAHSAYLSNNDPAVSLAYGIRLRLAGTNAPASATSVLALIDGVNQNLPGILCSTVYALAVSLPMVAQSTGAVPDVSYGFTYNSSYLGVTLYTQLLALDAGQSPIPLVVSNGRQSVVPVAPGFLNNTRCSYGWYSLPSTTGTATHFIGGGMVMLLQ